MFTILIKLTYINMYPFNNHGKKLFVEVYSACARGMHR